MIYKSNNVKICPIQLKNEPLYKNQTEDKMIAAYLELLLLKSRIDTYQLLEII